jgi:hypothetical protein
MRIKIICPQCSVSTGAGVLFVETIREDGLYTGKCPNGHDILVATQTFPHEMLFEIALNAIADRYHREAVASFASSIERYFEFAIRVICHKRGIELDVFEKTWDKVKNQSERQIGAYVFMYSLEFKEVPRLLNSKESEFRNSVVHKGTLPEKADVLAFGKTAYEIIQGGIRKLRETSIDDVNAVLNQHVAKISEKMGNKYPRTFQVTPTALNVIEDIARGYKPFEQLLAERQI